MQTNAQKYRQTSSMPINNKALKKIATIQKNHHQWIIEMYKDYNSTIITPILDIFNNKLTNHYDIIESIEEMKMKAFENNEAWLATKPPLIHRQKGTRTVQ